jgi:hypothetical protein
LKVEREIGLSEHRKPDGRRSRNVNITEIKAISGIAGGATTKKRSSKCTKTKSERARVRNEI